jgi:raffinose/stachyose/melibiose transport system substrate-binding protein
MKRGLAIVAVLAVCGTVSFATGKAEGAASTPTKLVFWNISAVEVLRVPYATAISEFQAKNPSIQIESVPFEPNSFQQTKVPTAVAANELPDIMYFWGGSNVSPFLSKLVALNDSIKDLQPRILGGMTDKATFDGKIYGLPTQAWVAPLYYNKTLFAKYNVKLPVTFDDMLAAVKTFAANSVPSFTGSGQDSWTLGFYIEVILIRTAGIQKYRDAAAGKISWNDPDLRKGFDFALRCIQAGAFDPSILALNRDESEVPFKTGKVAMYYHGSWLAPSLDPGTFGAINFPYDGAQMSNSTLANAACNDFLYATTAAKNKDAAVFAVKGLAEEINRQGYQVGSTLPCYNFATPADTSKLSSLVKDVAAISAKSTAITNGSAWDFAGVSRTAAQRYYELYTAFAANKLSVDQMIAESDKAAKLQ